MLKGFLKFEKGSAFNEEDYNDNIPSRVLDADQSNSSLIYNEKYFLKLYRKLFPGMNPDVEMVKFLTEKSSFPHIPAFAGTFFWKKSSGTDITFAMMQQKVAAIKDAWSLAGDYLDEYLTTLSSDHTIIPDSSLHQAAMLGKLTAEMHEALTVDAGEADFASAEFDDLYIKWLLGNCDSLVKRRLRLIKDCYASLDEKGKELSKFYMSHAAEIMEFFSRIRSASLQSLRIRIHGDYHLGQVLFNESDYTILDFEGEPESSITERKIKHSPLKDVAGMLRSFHYAVSAKIYFSSETIKIPQEKMEDAVSYWYKGVTHSFLNSYRETIKGNAVLNAGEEELKYLLQFHLLEKAVYELGYELNARPAWVKIPLRGIQQVIKGLST